MGEVRDTGVAEVSAIELEKPHKQDSDIQPQQNEGFNTVYIRMQ